MPSIPVSSLSSQDLDSTLREDRVFPPPPEFSAKAHIKSLEEYEALYKQSIEDPEALWAGAAKELHWFKTWDKVFGVESSLREMVLVGGKINLSYNLRRSPRSSDPVPARPPSSGKANRAKSAASPTPSST